MDVLQAIKERRSVRNFKPEAVPEESLRRVLEAARLAPSAHNAQEWKFVVVKDKGRKEALAEAALGQSFIAQAPVVIVAVALNPGEIMASEVPAYAVDLAIAVDHITLQAAEEGLGTCWVGAFSQREVKRVLDIPGNYKVVAILPVGFPADRPGPKTRKGLGEVVCYETFKE